MREPKNHALTPPVNGNFDVFLQWGDLGADCFALYCEISMRMGDNGVCWPSLETLAKGPSCSGLQPKAAKRKILRLLTKMDEAGRLIRARSEGGRGRRTLYAVRPPHEWPSLEPTVAEDESEAQAAGEIAELAMEAVGDTDQENSVTGCTENKNSVTESPKQRQERDLHHLKKYKRKCKKGRSNFHEEPDSEPVRTNLQHRHFAATQPPPPTSEELASNPFWHLVAGLAESTCA